MPPVINSAIRVRLRFILLVLVAVALVVSHGEACTTPVTPCCYKSILDPSSWTCDPSDPDLHYNDWEGGPPNCVSQVDQYIDKAAYFNPGSTTVVRKTCKIWGNNIKYDTGVKSSIVGADAEKVIIRARDKSDSRGRHFEVYHANAELTLKNVHLTGGRVSRS